MCLDDTVSAAGGSRGLGLGGILLLLAALGILSRLGSAQEAAPAPKAIPAAQTAVVHVAEVSQVSGPSVITMLAYVLAICFCVIGAAFCAHRAAEVRRARPVRVRTKVAFRRQPAIDRRRQPQITATTADPLAHLLDTRERAR